VNDDRLIEREARLWLEEGPTQAPEHAVRAALQQIETTRQDRRWPVPVVTPRLFQTARAGAAIAAVLVVAAGGLLLVRPSLETGPGISPSPSPVTSGSPAPSATPGASGTPEVSPAASSASTPGPGVLITTFTSPMNGYSLQYPGDWTVTPATASWAPQAVNQWGSPALDELKGSSARLVGTSQPLAAGQTADDWLLAYGDGACSGPVATWQSVPIGNATGLIDADGCVASGVPSGKGGPLFDAVVIYGGRAYNFAMAGELSHADFLAVLATVTLDPASATTPPAP